MRTIQKQISLEPMTSRMPSIWPAYKDGRIFYFDDESLKKRKYLYPSNYGMIPMNISFKNTTSATSISELSDYNALCDVCSGDTDCFSISFERLSNIYHFFKEYYHLLNDYGHCNRTYSSATEYYRFESGERYAEQMEYGTNEDTYINLDEEFERLGGKVNIESISGGSGATDSGFYRWICTNVVPTYHISKEYKEYWNRDKLYYPDVIRWMAWLSARRNYEDEAHFSAATENEIEHWNCKESGVTNCCDCDEYFNRGGQRELNRMQQWYSGVQQSISAISAHISNSAYTSCFTPSIDDKIDLHNSLDDLGEFSIFSTDYQLGIDYRTANYGDSGNTHSGTVVTIDDEPMILVNGRGFCYSPHYMEKIFDENAWESYSDRYMNENPNEFVSSAYTFYAYDEYGNIHTGNTSGEVKKSMSAITICPITEYDAILIDDTLFPIEETEYGVYDPTNQYIGGKTFFVYREKDTSTPYTYINGKKIYADWSMNDNCYYFSFFRSGNTNSTICNNTTNLFNINDYYRYPRKLSGHTIEYVKYDGIIYQVSGSGVTIDDIEYPRISGYTYDRDDNIMYVISGNVYDERMVQLPSGYTIEDDDVVIGIDYEPTIYNTKEITGRTISKLTDLELTNTLVDDIGNKIDGIYNVNSATTYNHQPPQGEELNLLYEVGNVSNIRRLSSGITTDDINAEKNYFYGNIITDMVFYYKDIDGNQLSATTKEWSGSSLDTIHLSQTARAEIENSSATTLFDGDDIYCDITYYMGATLERKKDESGYTLAYFSNSGYSYGVEYKETVKFVKENREYYLKKPINGQIPTTRNSVSAHSVSYPIFVYKMTQELENIETSTYNTYYEAPLADFKVEINLVNNDLESNYSNYIDLSGSTKVNTFPMFKQEYLLGVATMENVDSDIYIERGINAAFEKHLKLGEVASLEALLQYGNSYFKIMES